MASRSSTTSIAPAYRAVAPGALATTVTSAPSRLAPRAALYPAMPPPMTITRLIAPRTPRLRREFAGTPSPLCDASRVGHVALQLLDQIVHGWEFDVGMEEADEIKL